MARPHKWNKDRQTRIVDAIAAGNYPETAARLGGIGESTYYEWMAKGRSEDLRREEGNDPDSDLDWAVEFFNGVQDAQAKAEARAVLLITRAAVGTWQAAAWWLERKYPSRYGRVVRNETSGPAGGPVQVESVSIQQLEERVTAILGSEDEDEDDSSGT